MMSSDPCAQIYGIWLMFSSRTAKPNLGSVYTAKARGKVQIETTVFLAIEQMKASGGTKVVRPLMRRFVHRRATR